MKIYYINLKNSKERKKKLLSQINKTTIPYKRIDAVYGKDMSSNNIEKLCYKPSGMLCSKSIIGCYASHIKAWKEFRKDNEDYGIIMEDDCIISKDFQYNLQKILNEIERLNPSWDFLYLGYYNLHLFSMFESPKRYVHRNAKTYTTPSGLPLGFHCYVINKKSVGRLIDIMKTMYYHIDLQFYFLSGKLNVVSSKKKLARQLITPEESTQIFNFPIHMNKIIDSLFHREDSISPSYILSSSLVKIPFIECNITTYMLIFLLILRTFKKWRTFIFTYLLMEWSWCQEKDILVSNLLLYCFS